MPIHGAFLRRELAACFRLSHTRLSKRVRAERCRVAAATQNTATFCAEKRRRFLRMYRAKPPTDRHFSAQKRAMFAQSGVAGLKLAASFRRKHAP